VSHLCCMENLGERGKARKSAGFLSEGLQHVRLTQRLDAVDLSGCFSFEFGWLGD